MGGACSKHGRDEICVQNFGPKTWKRLHGRPKHRWEDSIRMDLREIGREDMGWIHLNQERESWRPLVDTVMNRVP